jgi:hypothetical protein
VKESKTWIATVAPFAALLSSCEANAATIDAVAKLLSAVAWPTVVLVLLLSQRKLLASVFGRLQHLKVSPTGIEAEIREVQQAEVRVVERSGNLNPEPPSERQVRAAEKIGELSLDADASVISRQVHDLAMEYERIRASMRPSDSRTRRMEVVVTKMRTLAFAAYPLLDRLTKSTSTGERLAAVAILEVRSNPAYLGWLAERFSIERPFIAYHAGVALSVAARTLDRTYSEQIRTAIHAARNALGPGSDNTDRARVLENAEKALTEDRVLPERTSAEKN